MANKYAIETAFSLIDRVTEPLAKIGVKGNAVGKQLKKDFMKAQDQLTGIGKAAKKAGIAIVAAGAAAAGAFAIKGIKDAIEFNKEFTKVSTVADTTQISLEELNKQIMAVSNSTGVAAKDLATLQYEVINSGIKTVDSAAYIEAAVKTSKAAFTDAGIVVSGLTKVMNAYQLEASEAEKITGQMYLTTTIGNASFEELNSSLSKVLPTAARLNVKTDDLFASIATLTANSIETPKAVKGIEKILETVQAPTARTAEAARRLGIDFSTAALESKGLAKFLQEIQEKTGGSEQAIMSLFGSVDSLNAINILTSRGADTFAAALNEMQNAAGAVDTAFNKVMDSPAERWGRIMNKIKNAGINLGTALLPIVEKVMIKVDEFVDKLKDFDFQPIADKAASVFGILMSFAGQFLKLAGIIWNLRVPIIALIAVIAAYKGGMLIAAAAVNVFSAAQNIKKAVMLATTLITGNQTKAMALYKAGTMGASIQVMLFAARQKAATAALAAQAVVQKAVAVVTKIATIAQIGFNAAIMANPIGLIVAGVVALIAGIILLVKNFTKIKEVFGKVWSGIKNVASNAWEGMKNAGKKAWEGIKNITSKAGEWTKKNWKSVAIGMVSPVAGGFKYLYDNNEKFRNVVDKTWNKIKDVAANVWGGIKNIASSAWEGIKNNAEAAFPGITEKFTAAINIMKEKIAAFTDFFKEKMTAIKDFFSGIGQGIKNIFSGNKEVIPEQITNVVPSGVTQTTSSAIASNITPNIHSNRTITAAAVPATPPVTRAEQYSYSQNTNREEVDISVRAEQGSQARVARQPRSPNVRVAASGGNG